MSLTLDPQKAKISKRKHGEQVAIHYYRHHGFLPWAMVNFLVLLGWSTPESREFFTREELIKAFSLDGIGRTNSVFNIDADDDRHFTDPKLMSINAHYLRTLPVEALLPMVKRRLQEAGLWNPDYEGSEKEWFLSVIALIRGRFQVLTDFVSYGRPYFSDDFPVDEGAVTRNLRQVNAVRWLPELAHRLERLPDFNAVAVEGELRRFLEEFQIKAGLLVNALRTAVTGQGVGPDFMKVLTVIGQSRVVQRMLAACRMLS